ncbi:MAG: porphobilinogen synthase [Kiritimatiellae bacterium]|nr:porphobilinogen synthase [Kiritimatiellia bacterium]
MDLSHRPRRLRRLESIRGLVRETRLDVGMLIYPMFLVEGEGKREPIDSMPGQFRYSIDTCIDVCRQNLDLGIAAVNLFGYCDDKNDAATGAYAADGLIPRAVTAIKAELPQLCVQTDVALDPYTHHGHDGLVVGDEVVNDPTVDVLCRMALAHAAAGVDWVAPSDMMDGRVGAIRRALDDKGYNHVGILAYSAKYASAFYGPFRGALKSAPKKGDKKSYQMDPANRREALHEMQLDIEEGADVIMVKPALAYLDIIADARASFDVPIAAYNVSGEYSMLMAAAEKGWVDADEGMLEMVTSIHRAGADMVLTYFAPRVAALLNR